MKEAKRAAQKELSARPTVNMLSVATVLFRTHTFASWEMVPGMSISVLPRIPTECPLLMHMSNFSGFEFCSFD